MTESTRKVPHDTLWESTRSVPVTDVILHTSKCTRRLSAVSERGHCKGGATTKGLGTQQRLAMSHPRNILLRTCFVPRVCH